MNEWFKQQAKKMEREILEHQEQERLKKEEIYNLPDGSKVRIAQEKYQCPELLFQPQFFQIFP